MVVGSASLSRCEELASVWRLMPRPLGVTRAVRVDPDYYDVKEVYFHGKRPQFGNSLFGAQLL